jgi:FtsH-binding integral membrane protein
VVLVGSALGSCPQAASIFLDVLNVFLFFLQIFSGGSER